MIYVSVGNNEAGVAKVENRRKDVYDKEGRLLVAKGTELSIHNQLRLQKLGIHLIGQL